MGQEEKGLEDPVKSPGKIPYTRILQLDRMLRRGRLLPLDEIARQWGVTRRTVERDLACLRDYFKAPLEYNRSTHTYAYANSAYRLPAIVLSLEEMVSIFVCERLLRQHAGTPFEPVLRTAFEKLSAMLPEKACFSVDVENLCRAMSFEQGVPAREYPFSVFRTLLENIQERRRTEIVYYSRQGNREEGTRFVDPYHQANRGGEWHLLAQCL